MRIEKTHAGIIIADIIAGYRVARLYIGYSVRDAKKLFREERKKGGASQ